MSLCKEIVSLALPKQSCSLEKIAKHHVILALLHRFKIDCVPRP